MSEQVALESDRTDDSLDEILLVVRYRMTMLFRAICNFTCIGAWSEARELARLLDRAEEYAAAIADPEPHEAAEREIDKIYRGATCLLALAPTPSDEAIRQVKSTDWQADRSAWEWGERLWVDARKRGDRPQGLTRSRRRADTRPDSSRSLPPSPERGRASGRK